ncbi:MAG TPA: tetratricopeptide repeat protein, partial [Streptosporangiaceae bacterium]|nr:tetratricopeptide repeat protein [Streptosporangiaceae bacterium]
AQILRQEARPVADQQAPFQLPAAIADFVGRSAESARLIDVLRTSHAEVGVPVAGVSGPPGVGKTSLVLRVAHRLRADFPDGQLWAHVAGTSSSPPGSDEVLGEFLRALGVTGSAIPSGSAERAALYRSRLAGRRVLVVIDDAASVDQVRPLIPGTVGCAVLITSRFQLTGLDGAHIVPLEALTTADAMSMLSRIAGRSRIDAQPEAAELLVKVCGALPLALRIVGSKLAARPSWPLGLMAKRLVDASTRVGELEAGGMSVWATIESSYQLLSDRAALAFRLLALLGPGDFAAWVVGVLLDSEDASAVVRELEDRSLLTAVGADTTGEARYRLHDLVRDFAGQRLDMDQPGLREQALARLLAAWLQLVTEASGRLPADRNFLAVPPHPVDRRLPSRTAHQLVADPVAWFSAERGNVRNAVEAACLTGRLDIAMQLIAHQSTFFSHQCRYDDAERLWSSLHEHAERLADPAFAVLARLHVATAKVLHGHPADALALLNDCVGELEKLGNPLLVSSALEWRATCFHDLDMYEQATVDAERALAAARRSGSRYAEQRCLVTLANGLTYGGDAERAVEVGEEALELARDLNAPTFEFASMVLLAQAYCKAGRFDQGIASGRGALALSRRLTDLGGEGLALGVLGDVYRQAGREAEAVDTFLLALPIFRDRASPRYYAVCLHKLGLACAAMGSGDAVAYLEESARVFRELGVLHRAERVRQDLDRCRGLAGWGAVTLGSSVA